MPAEEVMLDVRRLWIEGTLEQRQRLQKVLFPDGVTYSAENGFGAAETAVSFTWLAAVPSPNAREATLTMPSWNQILAALRELDALRRTEAA